MKEKLKGSVSLILEKGHLILEAQRVANKADLFWIGRELHKTGLSWRDLLLFLKTMNPKALWVTDLCEQVFATGASNPKNLEPVITGDHLIKKGLRPGKEFNDLLNRCLKIQYEQGITNADRILEEIL